MQRIFKLVFVSLFCFFIGASANFLYMSYFSQKAISEKIMHFTLQFNKAVLEKDKATLEMILDDNINLAVPHEKRLISKDELISRICNHGLDIKSIQITESSIKLNNEVSEIDFKQIEQVRLSESELNERWSKCKFYYKKRNGEWRLTSIQLERTSK